MKKIIIFGLLIFTIIIATPNVFASTSKWETVGSVGFSEYSARFSSLKINSDNIPYIVYIESSGKKINIVKFNGIKWEEVIKGGIAINDVGESLSFAINKNNLYISYVDGNVLSIKTIINNKLANFSTEGLAKQGLVHTVFNFDKNNIPYLLTLSSKKFGNPIVSKFNGVSWEKIGAIDAELTCSALIFDANNLPYVGCTKQGVEKNIFIKKYDGNTWVNIGNPDSYAIGVINVSFSGTTPYISFSENESKISVKKYNGTNWIRVGDIAGSNDEFQTSPAFAIDKNGSLYISYIDLRTDLYSRDDIKQKIKKFDGTSWLSVGNSTFLSAHSSSIIFDNNNIPYTVYKDGMNTDKLTVKKFIDSTLLIKEKPVNGSLSTSSLTSQQLKYNLGDTTLKNGSKGEAVKELQRFLNDTLNLGLVIDGSLGPKTIAIIKKWQKNNGLNPDGLIGSKTKAIINK